MKPLVWLALLFGMALAQAPTPVLEARQSVVMVWERDTFKCSGFAISVNLVLTAAHCVGPVWPIAISRADLPEQRVNARVLARRYDTHHDQALLRVEDDAALPLRPLYRCAEMPQPGDPLWVWGSPLGFAPLLRAGIYSGPLFSYANALTNRGYGVTFATTINIDQGASGAAVLTSSGCYVGIISHRFSPSLKLDGALFKKPY